MKRHIVAVRGSDPPSERNGHQSSQHERSEMGLEDAAACERSGRFNIAAVVFPSRRHLERIARGGSPSLRRALLVPPTLAVAAGLLAACGDSPDATRADGGTDVTEDAPGHGGARAVAAGARHIEVTGKSFAFDPDEITVDAGEDIAIVLTSEDALHDFTVDDLDAHVAAEAGETAIGGLRADEPGRYTFYCSVAGHREAGMEGKLVVEA